MLTPQELQTLRNLGHDDAADEIELLRAENADLRWLAIAIDADCEQPAHRREHARKLLSRAP